MRAGSTTVDEGHARYELVFSMMVGIRHSLSDPANRQALELDAEGTPCAARPPPLFVSYQDDHMLLP